MKRSRRDFLKRGLLGGTLLFLGGLELSLCPTKRIAVPKEPLSSLDARAFQVMVAIASRIVTANGADPVAIAHGVDRMLTSALPESREGINELLGLFENALPGLLLDGRAKSFTFLSPESQDAVLDSWRTSRITLRRCGYQALRKMALVAHYQESSSWGPVGYTTLSGLVNMAYDDSKVGTPEWLRAQEKGDAP